MGLSWCKWLLIETRGLLPKCALLLALLGFSPFEIWMITPTGIVGVRKGIIPLLVLLPKTHGIEGLPPSVLDQLWAFVRRVSLHGTYATRTYILNFWPFHNLRKQSSKVSHLILKFGYGTYLIHLVLPWGASLSNTFVLLSVQCSIGNQRLCCRGGFVHQCSSRRGI